jgi:hypothetical protein
LLPVLSFVLLELPAPVRKLDNSKGGRQYHHTLFWYWFIIRAEKAQAMKSTALNHCHQTGSDSKFCRKPPARAHRDSMAGTNAPAISMVGLTEAIARAIMEEHRLRMNKVNMKKKNIPASFINGVAK